MSKQKFETLCNLIIKYSVFMDYQQYKVIKLILSFSKMEQSTQNPNAGLPLAAESMSSSETPFYVVYLSNNMISNFDYSNFFQLSHPNSVFVQNIIPIQQQKLWNPQQPALDSRILQEKAQQINASQINQQTFGVKKTYKASKSKPKPKQILKNSQDQDYQPQGSSQFQMRAYKLSETKNIPKNYERAILFFISKNISYTYKVVQHCNLNFQQFMKFYNEINTELGSIAKLRSLWMDSENLYAKVFRIISKQYLRKHNLGYIFNSRVMNVSKHIKYRQIIQQSIGKPESFTYMKEY